MIRRPPRSTRTDTLFPTRRSSDLQPAPLDPPLGRDDRGDADRRPRAARQYQHLGGPRGAMTSSRAETVTILAPTGTRLGGREIAVEAPVAIEVTGLGYAVMMMTPEALDRKSKRLNSSH